MDSLGEVEEFRFHTQSSSVMLRKFIKMQDSEGKGDCKESKICRKLRVWECEVMARLRSQQWEYVVCGTHGTGSPACARFHGHCLCPHSSQERSLQVLDRPGSCEAFPASCVTVPDGPRVLRLL